MKTNKSEMFLKAAAFALLLFSVVFSAACNFNHSGAFQGNAEYQISTLIPHFSKTDKIENMTFTVERHKSLASTYVLKFGENSPLQCSLEIYNRFFDREGKGEETEDVQVDGKQDQACKVRGKKGEIKTAHVVNRISGSLFGNKENDRNYLKIRLYDGTDHYEFTFTDGKRVS